MIRENFDSGEEFFVYHWLKEAEEHNLVSDIDYQPEPFLLSPRASVTIRKELKTKTKMVDLFLFHPHQYTADFSFFVSDKIKHLFVAPKFTSDKIVIDVKGSFNMFGDPKQFSINQKWCWNKFGVYIEKIVPGKLFKKSWVPDECRFTPKKRQPVKKYVGVKTISEFLRVYNYGNK